MRIRVHHPVVCIVCKAELPEHMVGVDHCTICGTSRPPSK